MAATTSDLPAAGGSTTGAGGSITADGPVLTVITKRIRALRKKLNRIHQMEDSISQGKTLNKEQQEVLRSKPSLLNLIDELEKLRSPLAAAVEEELASVVQPPPPVVEQPPSSASDGVDNVKELLNLMYFGSLFDVRPQSEFTSLMLTRTHERGCCLSYDYVNDDATDLLGEKDLDLISALQGMIISRPVSSTLSHQNAMEKCIEHAKNWINKSDQPIDDQSNVTYASVREKLNKIMASDYFTATPQMKGPVEVAAAAGVGSFGSFEVAMHDPVEVPVQVEGSVEQYQDSEANTANYEHYEPAEEQSGTVVQEFQKDELNQGNSPEVVSVQADQEQPQHSDGGAHVNEDLRDQQFIPRRNQRGFRGGGRRGYSNGQARGGNRGGGPYQNGRGQYYDNYYPRNYYPRRGGRGSSGGSGGCGGNSYYNNSSTTRGDYDNQANAGVAS